MALLQPLRRRTALEDSPGATTRPRAVPIRAPGPPPRRRPGLLRRYATPVGLLLLLGLAVLSGVVTGFNLAFRLAYLLSLMLVVAFAWSRAGFAGLRAFVERPTLPLRVGEQLRETVVLTSHGGLPKPWLEAEDETDVPGLRAARVVEFQGLVAFRRFSITAELTQRGEFTLGPFKVRSSDPFGLFPYEKVYQGSERVLVYPRIVPVPDFALAYLNLSGDAGGRRRTHLLSPQASSVREYAAGDSISRIHWRSTARHSKLMVKLFDQNEAGQVWVVFDQHAQTAAGAGAESTDEYGATVAASAVEKYRGMQLPVGYACHGSLSLLAPPLRSVPHFEAISRHIAASRPEGATPLFNLLAELDLEVGSNTALIVVTAAGEGDWITALEGFQHRGVNVSVVLVDRTSFEGAQDGGDGAAPGGSADALGRLVAGGLRTYLVRRGEAIATALAQPVGGGPALTRLTAPDGGRYGVLRAGAGGIPAAAGGDQ